MARTEADAYVLVGHSLGARAMVRVAQGLGTAADAPRLQSVHLLGAAINAAEDWTSLTDAVEEGVYNYYSANDQTLRRLYSIVQGGQTAAGLVGMAGQYPKVHNIDVSDQVGGHRQYLENVELR